MALQQPLKSFSKEIIFFHSGMNALKFNKSCVIGFILTYKANYVPNKANMVGKKSTKEIKKSAES